jgi:[CysO sulfur-carrier protein]-S-L-cysteine hydrolase
MALRIAKQALAEIDRHAVEAYPDECCGAVLSVAGSDSVRRIRNIQNRLHAEDPVGHPRNARTAYFMEPKELYELLREVDEHARSVRFFYHSHPDHGAYFSEEDQARAVAWDEPAYPGTSYLVVSVVEGAVKDRLAVAWDGRERRFVATELIVD